MKGLVRTLNISFRVKGVTPRGSSLLCKVVGVVCVEQLSDKNTVSSMTRRTVGSVEGKSLYNWCRHCLVYIVVNARAWTKSYVAH